MQGDLDAADVIELLGLERHPEGGWFRETFRDSAPAGTSRRAASTLIYYLLEAGDVSHWHRVDAVEVWHFYAGAPLVLTLSSNGHDTEVHNLGNAMGVGQRPQLAVPAGWWQTAASCGAWSLVGCTVAPGFEFAGFELAPAGWRPASAG